jgi:hypothetical protein
MKTKIKRAIKNGALKDQEFNLIQTDEGLVPCDSTFPVGEDQLFQEDDLNPAVAKGARMKNG